MPDKERPERSVRLDYRNLKPPDAPPELDISDPHIVFGLALRHIEGVADKLAERLQRDGSTGWRSRDEQLRQEFSFDQRGVLGVYVLDATGSKEPHILCSTSVDSGRREVQTITVYDPSRDLVELLGRLPLLQRTTVSGSDERKEVPRSWLDITVDSFWLGLSRGPFHIVSGRGQPQTGEEILYSEVSGIHLIVGGRWQNGSGRGEEQITAYVVDVEWDFDEEGFAAHGRRSAITRGEMEKEVYVIPLMGTDEDTGLLDEVIHAFFVPAKALNIPIMVPKGLEETSGRVKRRTGVPEQGRRRISLNLGPEAR